MEDDNRRKGAPRVSIMLRSEEPCGCVNLRWIWLFGHSYQPAWAMCQNHVTEMLDSYRRRVEEQVSLDVTRPPVRGWDPTT